MIFNKFICNYTLGSNFTNPAKFLFLWIINFLCFHFGVHITCIRRKYYGYQAWCIFLDGWSEENLSVIYILWNNFFHPNKFLFLGIIFFGFHFGAQITRSGENTMPVGDDAFASVEKTENMEDVPWTRFQDRRKDNSRKYKG